MRFHISGSLEIDDLLAKDVQQAFDAALAKRGLANVEGDTADLHLRFQEPTNREKEFNGQGWEVMPAGHISTEA